MLGEIALFAFVGGKMSISSSMVKKFIVKKFYIEDNPDLNDDTALFSSGILDSFHLIDLVGFIETEADIRIGPFDMSLDNLDSIEKIVEFVNRKKHE